MAVEVIFTMASRRFRIFGSGTCSTLTSFLPYQQFALITSPLFRLQEKSGARHAPRRLLPLTAESDAERLSGSLLGVALARQRAVGDDDFAELDDLLEAAQVYLHLPVGVF